MIVSNRHAGKCIYCAFRAQQLVRQSRRLRSSAAAAAIAKANNGDGPTIRYSNRPTRRDKQAGPDERYAGKIGGEKSVIRRFLDNGPGEQGRKFRGSKPEAEAKENFNDALHKRMSALKEELKDAPVLEHIRNDQEAGDEKTTGFNKIWRNFLKQVLSSDDAQSMPWEGNGDFAVTAKVRSDLREAYRLRGINGLDERIKYAFYAHVTGSRFTDSDIRNQKALADLRYPTEWFPATRTIHRTIHLHVGPTNSGKTYHALQRLEQAETGVYAGPLRLLAHEVFTRMNAKGKPCALITGEERRSPQNAETAVGNVDMSACTVEMMPLNKTLDVAVIDEIQMIGNPERGWAWTQALLGVKATEVHLCGEERTVPLIKELCAAMGDKLEIHRYERLSPLKLAEGSLDGDLKRLRKGDCIVSFSVMGIHALRRQIEKQTGRKVATVYGSLPPETRAQQARLFNDPNNDYDYLVASDAVGMGLNLAIKRIIFEASNKFDGIQRRTLGIADIKQIAGRAGRYRTAEQASREPSATQDLAVAKGDSPAEVYTGPNDDGSENVGIVTTLEAFDFPIVAAAMSAEAEAIRTAGIFPPGPVLERFASYFPPGTPFSYILIRLHELSQMHSRFHLCGLRDQLYIADLIEPVQGLTVADRNIICSAPASRNDEMFKALMPALARCIAEQTGGDLTDIEELPLEVLEAEVSASREYLRSLEQLHKAIVTYLWLSYRFAGIFTTRALAFHVKGMVEEKIEDVLGQFSFSETQRKKRAAKREKELMREIAQVGLEEERAAVEESEVPQATQLQPPDSDVGSVDVELSKAISADEDADDVVEKFSDEATADPETEESSESSAASVERFAGEEDIELEDPSKDDIELAEEDKPAATSFAQWRAQQTRGESQGSKETEDADEDEASISEAFNEGEAEAKVASLDGAVEEPSEGRTSISDAMPAEAGEQESEASSDLSSSEQDVSDFSAPVTPETELSEHEPMETQAESPSAAEPRTTEEAADGKRSEASQPVTTSRRFGNELPAKHLVDIDVNATEVERNVDSRP